MPGVDQPEQVICLILRRTLPGQQIDALEALRAGFDQKLRGQPQLRQFRDFSGQDVVQQEVPDRGREWRNEDVVTALVAVFLKQEGHETDGLIAGEEALGWDPGRALQPCPLAKVVSRLLLFAVHQGDAQTVWAERHQLGTDGIGNRDFRRRCRQSDFLQDVFHDHPLLPRSMNPVGDSRPRIGFAPRAGRRCCSVHLLPSGCEMSA